MVRMGLWRRRSYCLCNPRTLRRIFASAVAAILVRKLDHINNLFWLRCCPARNFFRAKINTNGNTLFAPDRGHCHSASQSINARLHSDMVHYRWIPHLSRIDETGQTPLGNDMVRHVRFGSQAASRQSNSPAAVFRQKQTLSAILT